MSQPNKYYKTEAVLDARNCGHHVDAIKLILLNGGIDEIIRWALRANMAFEHDLDKSTMSVFGGEPFMFLKLKVVETEGYSFNVELTNKVESPFGTWKEAYEKAIWAECKEEMIGRLKTLKFDNPDNPARIVHNKAITEAINQIRI